MLCLLFSGLLAHAAQRPVQICVHDEQGNDLANARVQVQGGSSQAATTDDSGCASLQAEPRATVEVTRDGFSRVVQGVGESGHVTVVMRVAGTTQTVEVTATRT